MTRFIPDGLDWHAHIVYEHPDDSIYRRELFPARDARWLLHLLGGLDPMARGNSRGNKGFAQIEFVTINLDAKAEKDFAEYQKVNAEKLVSELAVFIADQHKLGITWDDANNCFIASATCKDEKSENYEKCISARSDDWSEALLLLLYKAHIIAKRGPWSEVSRPTAWG